MDLSIVIVNWRSADYVRACLPTLAEGVGRLRYEVLVIDNASYDACEKVVKRFPNARFIQSDVNLGFAKANNLAAGRAGGKVLLFLNPDTQVKPGAIETMRDVLCQSEQTGIVGARLLNSDGTLQTSCVQSFPTIVNQALDSEFLRRLTPRSGLWGVGALHRRSETPSVVDTVCGAALMIQRDVFERVGGFTPCYFMYSEDIDLCFKVRQAGYAVVYVPTATITHHGGGSSRQEVSEFSVVTMRESQWRYFQRNRSQLYAGTYRAAMAASAGCRIALAVVGLLASVGSRNRHKDWQRSLKKWWAILRWSFGVAPNLKRRDGAPDREDHVAGPPAPSARAEVVEVTRPACSA